MPRQAERTEKPCFPAGEAEIPQPVIPVKTIDSAAVNTAVSCIKIDAEGDEREVLAGASETIWKNRPSLNVSLYHRAGDLWKLPLLLHRMDGKYKLYIRKKEYVPMWDISVFCMP